MATRITLLDREDMSEEQKEAYDEIAAGPRGGVRGPLLLWLHSPKYARLAQRVGETLRWHSTFGMRLTEFAILITARHYSSDYVWHVHSKFGRDHGLEDDIIDDLAHRRRPTFSDPQTEAVYDFATEVLEKNHVSDSTLERVKGHFGERGAIELGAIIAHYHLGHITLSLAEMPLPEGATPLPA